MAKVQTKEVCKIKVIIQNRVNTKTHREHSTNDEETRTEQSRRS